MKIRTTITALAGAATLVVSLGLPAYSAQAAPANTKSTTQAGYGVSKSAFPASATVKFKVPTVTATACPPGPTSEVAVTSSVRATLPGTPPIPNIDAAFLVIICNGPSPDPAGVIYSAGAYLNDVADATTLTPAPGDTLSATVTVSATKTTVTIKDVTKAMTVTDTGTTPAGETGIKVFDGMSNIPNPPTSTTTFWPITNFGKVNFSGAKLDGVTPLVAHATAFNLFMGTITQISTGALNLTGNGWTATWKHS
jgi:hypothetical protein